MFGGGGGKNFVKAGENVYNNGKWGSEAVAGSPYGWTVPKDLAPGQCVPPLRLF